MPLLIDIAMAVLTTLLAIVVIYYSAKFFGKVLKTVVIVVVVILVLVTMWFLFGDTSILQSVPEWLQWLQALAFVLNFGQ